MSQTISARLEFLRHRRRTLGEPAASKGCTAGSAGRGWCAWATKTWPLTRQVRQGTAMERNREGRRMRTAEPILTIIREHPEASSWRAS